MNNCYYLHYLPISDYNLHFGCNEEGQRVQDPKNCEHNNQMKTIV